jgi:hypothetical protein
LGTIIEESQPILKTRPLSGAIIGINWSTMVAILRKAGRRNQV